ncbi:hypothetical protein BRADI_3g18725v3 [Brachypodium distachyon]|uniref:Uncharacterized protein n=1 Tax=Brachypodium distachyon TaxID=15368 RepID=A0A2K2CY57_BRADI|nr:hypothetical protein BRADI_3g18725v3 [Brachypodium distachyon]
MGKMDGRRGRVVDGAVELWPVQCKCEAFFIGVSANHDRSVRSPVVNLKPPALRSAALRVTACAAKTSAQERSTRRRSCSGVPCRWKRTLPSPGRSPGIRHESSELGLGGKIRDFVYF